MQMKIRLAKKSDKNSFVKLALERDAGFHDVNSCYKPYKKSIGNPVYWSRKFDNLIKEKRLILACNGKKPVGLLYFTLNFIDYPVAHVELVFVSKTSRRLGIAKKLFNQAEKIIKSKDYAKIFSSTNPSNKISLEMHKKLGYKRCGSIYGIETPTSREIFVYKNLTT